MTDIDWRRDDYEKSCLYASAKMRERLIKTGQIMPRPDNPEEVAWHEDWKAGKGGGGGGLTQFGNRRAPVGSVPATHLQSRKMLDDMDDVDAMPAEMREVVHEFGLPIVNACLNAGVRRPAIIRQLVTEIWDGARQTTQKRRRGAQTALDWLLIQAGAQISAATLFRVLRLHGTAIIPMEPTREMVDASMDAVNHMGVVSKSTKHRNRLRAAIRAGMLGGGD